LIVNNNSLNRSTTSFRIVNPNDNSEFFEISNLKDNAGLLSMNLESSSGQKYEGIEIRLAENEKNYASNQRVCPWCTMIGVVALALIEAAVEISDDDYDSNCAAAIASCGDSGVAEVEITDSSWFGQASCKVTCK